MHEIDGDGFLGCFDATPEERDALSKFVGSLEAMQEFRDRFVKAYGEDAWNDFQDPEKAPEEGNATFNLVGEAELSEMDAAVIDIKGDTATFSFPREESNVTATKVDGGWLLDATTFLPAGAEPEAFGDMMERTGEVTRKYMKAIGHEGIAPEDIDAELGRALASEIAGATNNAEHRFNIDEL